MRVRLNQQRLLAFLAQSPLSQNHWALKLGLSRGHWSEIVNGKHPFPSAKTRDRMLEVLGLPFEELFEIESGTPSWADTDFRRVISDRYLIDAELGQGGMGAVYLARDVRHGRVVAVKVISPEAVSGIGITRFLREIATVAQLQHPHILPLFDSGEAAGRPFYVMPCIRGGSLRARLQEVIRLPTDEAVALTIGIASALQHAHAQRILHCDVKPENILLDGSHPYVMDFGVARKLHTEVLPWTLRRELDFSAGTPAYVSPEQASGEQELDPRADVYSLACVVYEMLAGRPPFEGPTTQAVVSRRFIAPPPPIREFAPEVPPLLDQVIERGMALEPGRRPTTAAEFSAAVSAGAKPASGPLSRVSVALTRGMSRLRRRSRPGASIRLGNVLMDSLWQDLRHAFRALGRSPAFSLIAVLVLALGIGANTAIFSVVRGVLLKPLPHKDGNRLVYLRHSMDRLGGDNLNFSVPEVRDLRSGVPALSGMAEYSTWSAIHQWDDGAERIPVGLITGNYFEVMGLSTVIGRITRPSDDGPGAAPVAVLTYDFWKKRFGGDSAIVGKQILLDKRSVRVVGVLQPAPFFPERVDALLNLVNSEHHLGASMQEDRIHRMTEVVARVRPTATVEEARNQVAVTYARMQKDYTQAYNPGAHYRVAVIPFKEALGERARLTLWLLMGAAALVMIISAASVANLTLMRGVRREHELVVRAALGAGVARMRRLLLAENMLLALVGAAVGVGIALGGVKLLTSLAERYSPRAGEIRLDAVVLGFTVGLAGAVALLLSFLASLPREGGLASRILAGATRMSGGLKGQRLQRGLVVVQIAVSVMLLAGAGLVTRAMLRFAEVDTGLTSEEVLTLQVPLLTRAERRDSIARSAAVQRYEEMQREIAALPGVLEVGAGSTLPLRNSGFVVEVQAEGRPAAASGEVLPRAEFRDGTPEFLRASGVPLVAGEIFTRPGVGDTSGQVVINERLRDELFPNEDPLGKRIAFRAAGITATFVPWVTVVGVVGNTLVEGLDEEPPAAVYVPSGPTGTYIGGGLVIRARSNAALLKLPVERIVRRIAPTALLEHFMTISEYKDRRVAPRRLNAVLLSSFGVLAVIIAAVGIAGVLAFSVSARTNEIGIRMSLGADAVKVQRMILREGGTLLAIGLGLGITGAFASAGVIRRLLFGIQPHDPITFIGVSLAMAAIGVAACWIPAQRAARIDPAIAMRSE